jgi:hypothetical protein
MTARAMWAIFLGALAVRGANVLSILLSGGTFQIEDTILYYDIVDDWLRFGDFVHQAPDGHLFREFERPPLYPAFLIMLEYLWGRSDAAVAAVQAALDAATCVLVALSAARVSPRIGLIAGWLAVLSPALVTTSTLVVNDTLYLFLQSLGVYLLLRFGETGRPATAGLSGLAFGLATITRPLLQFLLPVLFLFAVVFAIRRAGAGSRRLAAVALFAVALALPIAPVLKGAHDAYGEYFLTRQGGVHLLGWVVPAVHPDTSALPFDEANKVWSDRFQATMAAQGTDVRTLSAPALQAKRQQFAVSVLMGVPPQRLLMAWIRGAALNVALPAVLYDQRVRDLSPGSFSEVGGSGLWTRITTQLSRASPLWLGIVVTASVAACLATAVSLVGVVLLFMARPWVALLLIAAAGYYLGILGPVAAAKYRLPIEPILLIFTAVAIDRLVEWRRARRYGYR